MGIRTLGIFLTALCMMTTTLVSANDMATDSSISSSGSGNETVAQLLANVQAVVVDDPALANMFDISGASQMSDEELTTLLQDILTASLSSSYNASSSSSLSSSSGSVESTQSSSSAGSTVSGASTISLSVTMVVLATVAALNAAL